MRHTLPGERVVARVTEGRVGDSFVRADAVEVLEAAPGRVPAPCPYAGPGLCGGCDFQHARPTRSARSRARSCASSSPGWPASTSRSRCSPCPVTPTVCGGAPASSSRSTRPVGPACAGTGRARSCPSRTASSRRPASSTAACSTPSGPTSSRSTSSTRRTRTSRCSCRSHRPRGRTAAAAWSASSRATVTGRVSTSSGPGFSAGAPGRGHDVPHAVWRCSGPGRVTGRRPLRRAGLFTMRLGELVAPDGFVLGVEGDRRAVENGERNTEHLENVEWRANRVDRELRSLVSQGRHGRPRGARPAPHRSRQGGHGPRRRARSAPRRLRRVRPGGARARRAGGGEQGYALTSLEAWDAFPMTHHVECIAVLERSS